MKKMMTYLIALIVILITGIFIVGLYLPENRTFTKKNVLKTNVETVFRTVTDYKNQAKWRKDVKEIKVIDENTWTEIPFKGTPITFRTKQRKLNELFEIEIIEPENFNGYWIGKFKPTKENGCEIIFEEVIRISNPLMRTISYLFVNLDKTMDLYLQNLKEELGE